MTADIAPPLPRWTWPALAAIVAAGLALRIAAGTGGLWIDEAWSAIFAHETGSPLGVFLFINHDNNHHLNTIWLQLVGLEAPPLLARALAIASGTATIAFAGLIGARRGAWVALATASLFAVSEAMVTYASEARGYAPMLLAAAIAFYLVEGWLERDERALPARPLAWCTLLGMLGHLTMLFFLVALGAWVVIALWRRRGLASALGAALRLFWPSALVVLLLLALLIGAALASDSGFQVGSLVPFTLPAFAIGISQIVSSSFGPELRPLWLLPALVAALLLFAAARGSAQLSERMPFYLIAILGLPLVLGLLQPANAVILRYYLLSVFALLLFAGEALGLGIASGGSKRWLALALLVACLAMGLVRDLRLIENQRGASDGPVSYLAGRHPQGLVVTVANPRARAIVYSAAASRDYPIKVIEAECPETLYLLIDRDPGKSAPTTVMPCGKVYRAVASAQTNGLSGGDWVLYKGRGLQSAPTPVSDPPPAP